MKKRGKVFLSAILALCMIASLLPSVTFAAGAGGNSNAFFDKNAYSRKCVNYYYTDSGELVKDVLLDTMTHYNAVPSIINAAQRDGYYKANYIDRLGRNYSSANGHDIATVNWIKIDKMVSSRAEVPDEIYLDPVNGNDLNDGTSTTSAVKTLDRAKELVKVYYEDNYRTWYYPDIMLMNTLEITSSQILTLDGCGVTEIKRADGFTDVMIKVTGSDTYTKVGEASYTINPDTGVPEPKKNEADFTTKVELYNIIINGELKDSDENILKTKTAVAVNGAELKLSYGAVIKNNNAKVTERYTDYGSGPVVNGNDPVEYGAGGVHVSKASKLYMNGGIVTDNTCENYVNGRNTYTGAGGVYVESLEQASFQGTNDPAARPFGTGSSLIMDDGMISYNEGATAAIYAGTGGYYEINGGIISNNKTVEIATSTIYSMLFNAAGSVIEAPFEGRLNAVVDSELFALLTPINLNGGIISDNEAAAVITACSMYINGGTIQYNKRYDKTQGNNLADPWAVLRTWYLNVPEAKAEGDVPFVVKGNSDFHNVIYVYMGTCKMYKGEISDNTVYTESSDYVPVSALYLYHSTRTGGSVYSNSKRVETEIKNVSFTNNKSEFTIDNVEGGGAVYVKAQGASTGDYGGLTFENCEFTDNSTPKSASSLAYVQNLIGGGIGVYMNNTSSNADELTLNVKNCNFKGNYTAGSGGAIGRRNDGSNDFYLNIDNCDFTGNTAASPFNQYDDGGHGGGAVYVSGYDGSSTAAVTVKNSNFSNNTAGARGGAVLLQAMKFDADNCVFANNTAFWNDNAGLPYRAGGGAVCSCYDKGFTLKNSKLYGNKGANGGALAWNLRDNDTLIENCEIYGNSTDTAYDYSGFATYKSGADINYKYTGYGEAGAGGAICLAYSRQNKPFTIKNTNIYNNDAAIQGGGIHTYDPNGSVVKLENTKVSSNVAGLLGGGISNSQAKYSYINSEVSNNQAATGAGVFHMNPSNDNTELHSSRIINNKISDSAYPRAVMSSGTPVGRMGGGIFSVSGATITVGAEGDSEMSEISGNTADSGGGIVLTNGGHRVTVNNGKISNNRALTGNGGGIYMFNGGAIFTLNSGAEISGNTAWNSCGGGIYTAGSNTVAVNGAKIINNSVGKYGAGAYVDAGGNINFNYGEISNNYTDKNKYIDYSGSAIYKHPGGYVYINEKADKESKIIGDIRVPNPNNPYILKVAVKEQESPIFISVPETDRNEAEDNGSKVISDVLAAGEDYVVVAGGGYTITEDDFNKFAYLGNGDYELVLDTANNCIKVIESEKPKRSFAVQHIWADENDQDGIRPDDTKVIATLLANGEAAKYEDDTEVPPLEFTQADQIKMWTDIPKYDDGNNVINYSVKMMYSDSADDEYTPVGYIRTVSPLTEGYIFNLMSQHTPERINVTVNKLWRDNLKSYETREQTPEDIGITLKADGVAIEPESIDTASNARRWVYVWKDLPVYKDGVEINYTVDEANVPTGYSKSISYEADSEGDVEYTITNTLDGWEKTIIDAVEVNLPYPTSGQTLSQVAPTIIGSNYKIKSYKWLRRGSAVADDTVFEDGTEYGLQLELVPTDTDRMEFSDKVKTTVNVADGAPVTKSAQVATDFDSINLEWTFRSPVTSMMASVNLFGDVDAIRKTDCTINPPQQDRLPDYVAPVANGNGYSVGTVKWYDNSATPTEFNDRFTYGIPYSVQTQLKADTGYGFDFGETNISVGGNVRTNKAVLQANSTTSDIMWYFDAIANSGHNVAVTAENGSISVDKDTNVLKDETVTIGNIVPDAGYTADNLDLVVTRTGEDEAIAVTNNTFTMPGSNVTVKAIFKKIPAVAPTVEVNDLNLEYGYTENNTLTATVTDADDTIYTYTYQWYSSLDDTAADGAKIAGATESTYTVGDKNAGTYYYYCTVTATRKDNGEVASASDIGIVNIAKKNIESITAAVIDPVPKKTAGENRNVIIPANAKYIQSVDIVWKNSDNTPLAEDTAFEVGKQYTAVIVFKPISENYKFIDTVPVTINDTAPQNIAVSADGTVTAEYTYTIPDRPEPGIPYAVIENPEIVEYEYDSASLTAVVSNCDFTKYTYTYQWYDENDQAIADSNGNVTEKDQQIILPLPTGKEVGMEKYYLTVTGTAITAGDPVSGSSNDGIFVVEPKKITAITLTDVANPKVGEAPDTDAAIADTENYAQEGEIVWYDSETRVKEFDYDKNYTAKITLLPKNQNYAFAVGDGAVTVTVNGKTAEVEVTQNGNKAVVSYSGSDKTEPKPTPEATPEATPETTPEATPEATPETTPESTPEATPETTPESTPEATPEATPESTPEATPTASPAPTRRPSSGGGGGSSYRTATPKPTATPVATAEPTAKPDSDPNSGSGIPQLNKEDHFAYMTGYPDGSFMPDNSITRAEATVMFSRLIKESMENNTEYTISFTDVPADSWYAAEIGFMEQFGIIKGYDDGTFKPESPITRAEFATVATRFDRLTDLGENVFTDVEEDYWATPYILLAYNKGWVSGYDDGTFRPYNAITRAEVISIVNRMLERSCDTDYVDNNIELIKTYNDVTDEYWAYYDIAESSNGHMYEKNPDEIWTELTE